MAKRLTTMVLAGVAALSACATNPQVRPVATPQPTYPDHHKIAADFSERSRYSCMDSKLDPAIDARYSARQNFRAEILDALANYRVIDYIPVLLCELEEMKNSTVPRRLDPTPPRVDTVFVETIVEQEVDQALVREEGVLELYVGGKVYSFPEAEVVCFNEPKSCVAISELLGQPDQQPL